MNIPESSGLLAFYAASLMDTSARIYPHQAGNKHAGAENKKKNKGWPLFLDAICRYLRPRMDCRMVSFVRLCDPLAGPLCRLAKKTFRRPCYVRHFPRAPLWPLICRASPPSPRCLPFERNFIKEL